MTFAVEWMQSPPVRFALRDRGLPSAHNIDELVDFFEEVLKNTDTIGDALKRMEDPRNLEAAKKKAGVSGFRGVAKDKSKTSPWRVTIQHKGKQMRLGSFATIEEAIQVRLDAEAAIEAGLEPIVIDRRKTAA